MHAATIPSILPRRAETSVCPTFTIAHVNATHPRPELDVVSVLSKNLSPVGRRKKLDGETPHSAQRRVTHGAPAAPAPRLGSLGSPCTCTMVHLGSSAPNCTVHLGASELMRTRIKVLIRPLAPNRTVHLGASERLTVCVAQPGNGYTSARIAAKTFRLQLSYTKIKSG